MKQVLQKCLYCNEETIHDVGKKEATQPRGSYLRRRTSRCRRCGTREINNAKKGRRVIRGKNTLPKEEK